MKYKVACHNLNESSIKPAVMYLPVMADSMYEARRTVFGMIRGKNNFKLFVIGQAELEK